MDIMNQLEEIFAERLIKLVPDIHKAVCSGESLGSDLES
jgi:hypothetical protein